MTFENVSTALGKLSPRARRLVIDRLHAVGTLGTDWRPSDRAEVAEAIQYAEALVAPGDAATLADLRRRLEVA